MTNFVPRRECGVQAFSLGENLGARQNLFPPRKWNTEGTPCGLTHGETKFVLYRPSHNKEKKDKIVLVKDTKKRPAE